jgi:hypothetical protein
MTLAGATPTFGRRPIWKARDKVAIFPRAHFISYHARSSFKTHSLILTLNIGTTIGEPTPSYNWYLQ